MNFLNSLNKLFLDHNLHNFLITYLFSLLIAIMFWLNYAKLSILLIIILFNLNSLIYARQFRNDYLDQKSKKLSDESLEKQITNQITNYEWLQMILNQIWSCELVILFQKELNRFYIKNRNTEFKFYHFFLNENSPPIIDQIYLPLESLRKDEIVIQFRITIIGTVLLKLQEDGNDKNELTFINLLVRQYGFKKKSHTSTYQDANLKKKNFLSKEFFLHGRSRLILRPLINNAPYFTSLNFSLLDYPLMYSYDKRDLHESTDEFESKFYNYLIQCICLPFLHPNNLIILYAHRNYIKFKHKNLLKTQISKADQYTQIRLKDLTKLNERNNKLVIELSDKKLSNWYETNVIKNLDLLELELNCSTFYPIPLFITRINLIEIDNLVADCVLFIRIRIGQQSTNKLRMIKSKSPIINFICVLPVHDYYEQCTIQLIQINTSNLKLIKKCTDELHAPIWNQRFIKLPKDEQLIKPLGELAFHMDKKLFDNDNLNYNLNGQDFWLPLDSLRSSMIHLSCSCFNLSSSFKTLRRASFITKSLMITKIDLANLKLPIAFIKIYIENFVCTYKKDNKLKTRINSSTQIRITFSDQKRTLDLLRLTKKKVIFRSNCYFFAYDDPHCLDVIIELIEKDQNKNLTTTKTVENEDNKIRLINLIKITNYKGMTKSDLCRSEMLPIFIINDKDFNELFLKNKNDVNFKFLDREEYGKISLNLFIRYVNLNEIVLQKLLFAPEIRGYDLKFDKKSIKPIDKTTIQKDKQQIIDLEKGKKKLKTDECIGKLYFKLIDPNTLELGVIDVTNVPYDKTKRIKLQVIIELWKGNYKITTKKTPFTEIVNNPTFDSKFQFIIESANLQQYAIRFVVMQKSGFFRSILKILADRFCTIPLLIADGNLLIRTYVLKTDKKVNSKKFI